MGIKVEARNATEEPWEAVTLTLHYQDGDEVQTRTMDLSRREIESNERRESGDLGHKLSNDDFERGVFRIARQMASNDIVVTGEEKNQIRIVPSHAIIDLVITVTEFGEASLIETASA